MSEKMLILFTRDELSRISDFVRKDNTHVIVVDLHGLTVKSAKRLLKNSIVLDKEYLDICVVHGYNHGTAIKEMIERDFIGARIRKLNYNDRNKGRTILRRKR